MPNFQGTKSITLQPRDVDIPHRFTFTVCSAESSNDGWIPYGDGVASVAATAWTSEDDEDAELIASSSESNNVVTVNLSYPSTNGAGSYKIRFVITTDLGATIEADFDRVVAVDL